MSAFFAPLAWDSTHSFLSRLAQKPVLELRLCSKPLSHKFLRRRKCWWAFVPPPPTPFVLRYLIPFLHSLLKTSEPSFSTTGTTRFAASSVFLLSSKARFEKVRAMFTFGRC